MPQYVTTTLGIYPLPDWVKDDLADLKGHQKHDLISGDESPDVRAVYDDAREEVLKAQQTAGLDRIVEGQLRWDDMLAHPLTVHENVETGGLVRYYDNNNFYRDPIVQGELTPDGDLARDLEKIPAESRQAVIPGPYSLFDLATDEYYHDEAEFLGAVGEYLDAEVTALPEHQTLVLLEPSLVTNPPVDELQERVSTTIDTVATATSAEVIVMPYWGSLSEQTYAHLLDATIDAVGFDLVTEHADSLYNITEYGTTDDVALGLIDGQNTLVESGSTIRDRLDWFQEQLPAVMSVDTIYVTPNTELFYLPTNKFTDKLDALGTLSTEEVTA